MISEKQIVAVIQARMSSTRLPGKVLAPVAGRPLLWHVLHRLKKSKFIQTLCVATTNNPADDALADYAASEGAVVVRGPEDDLLARYALAAEATHADIIVRITADAPLVDAEFVDYLIEEMIKSHADFVMLKPGLSAIHEGADPMTREALDTLVRVAANDPVAREHVCSYFKTHRDLVKVAEIDLPAKWRFNGARLSIDTPADVTFIEAVYDRLHAQAGAATLTDLVALLTREPGLLQLNAHVQQKSTLQIGGLVMMRCDGGHATGFGHVRRCLTIAKALRDRQGLGVRFAMRGEESAAAMVRDAGFAVDLHVGDMSEIDWLLALAAEHKPLAMISDVRTDLSATSILRLRGADMIVALVDDGSPRRLAADAAFYPPVPQVFELDWNAVDYEPCVGWEWVALGHEALPPLGLKENRPRVLVSMGGSDPDGLTLTVVRALEKMESAFDVTIVVGPGADEKLEIELRSIGSGHLIVRNPDNLLQLMAQADVALLSFGVTAYEAAAVGVPALYVGLTNDHVLSASAFERAGFGLCLGLGSQLSEQLVENALDDLLKDGARRQAMSAAGRMNVDGRGARRIAERIAHLIDERREAFAGQTLSVSVARNAG